MTCQRNAFDGGYFDTSQERRLVIDGQVIGSGEPAWVIAEIGVNHDGSVERASRLISSAAEAGCDAVKLQCFRTRQLVTEGAPLSRYQRANSSGDQQSMLSDLELPEGAVAQLADTARSAGVSLIASPFDLESLEELIEERVPAIKIASGELTNTPLLRRAAASGVPLIVSTGMADWYEIEQAVEELHRHDASFVLMHCVSAYPTPVDEANIRCVETIAERTGILVGYSDHCTTDEPSLAARALGACVIERHITHDREAQGPDHAVSLSPDQFHRWVASLRRLEASLGTGNRTHSPMEDEARVNARKSLVAARDISAGEPLSEDMLTTRRPGNGIGADEWDAVIGQIVEVDLVEGTVFERRHLR